MQIYEAALGLNINHIADPYLVGRRRHQPFHKVRVFVLLRLTPGGSDRPDPSVNLKVILVKYVKQSVSSYPSRKTMVYQIS